MKDKLENLWNFFYEFMDIRLSDVFVWGPSRWFGLTHLEETIIMQHCHKAFGFRNAQPQVGSQSSFLMRFCRLGMFRELVPAAPPCGLGEIRCRFVLSFPKQIFWGEHRPSQQSRLEEQLSPLAAHVGTKIEGPSDGSEVGSDDGSEVGLDDGPEVGSEDGSATGDLEGVDEGLDDRKSVGEVESATDGADDGFLVGALVTCNSDGDSDDATDGDIDGEPDSNCDGNTDGNPNGDSEESATPANTTGVTFSVVLKRALNASL